MTTGKPIEFRLLSPDDMALMEHMLSMFGEAFEEPETYCSARPGAEYLSRLLGSDYFIALVALKKDAVVGAIAAYELRKFEQERSEIYIYDLAVAPAHRREGVGTALIEKLKEVAAERGAYMAFVQADRGNTPAESLYGKFGIREHVSHFDIAVSG